MFDAGDPITFTFVITNSGSQAAYNVTLSDPIPAIVLNPPISTDGGDFAPVAFIRHSSLAAASTADIPGFSGGAFSGAPTSLDNVTLANNDRVLVKDQTTPAQNGIYLVSDAALGNWSAGDRASTNRAK